MKMGHEYPEHDGFEVDDDVMFTPPGSYAERRGTVRKVTTARVFVEATGETFALHRSKYGAPYRCRRTSDHDRAHARWETETATWEAACPATKFLLLSRWGLGGDYNVRADGSMRADMAALDQIAAEANAIREWLGKRPREPR